MEGELVALVPDEVAGRWSSLLRSRPWCGSPLPLRPGVGASGRDRRDREDPGRALIPSGIIGITGRYVNDGRIVRTSTNAPRARACGTPYAIIRPSRPLEPARRRKRADRPGRRRDRARDGRRGIRHAGLLPAAARVGRDRRLPARRGAGRDRVRRGDVHDHPRLDRRDRPGRHARRRRRARLPDRGRDPRPERRVLGRQRAARRPRARAGAADVRRRRGRRCGAGHPRDLRGRAAAPRRGADGLGRGSDRDRGRARPRRRRRACRAARRRAGRRPARLSARDGRLARDAAGSPSCSSGPRRRGSPTSSSTGLPRERGAAAAPFPHSACHHSTDAR